MGKGTRATHKTDGNPIIGRCVLFMITLWPMVDKMPKTVKHPLGDKLKDDSLFLMKYAIRQINGQDYFKRAKDIIEELHVEIYAAFSFHAFTKEQTMVLDCDLESILKTLEGTKYGQNMEVNSLKVEQ